MEPTAPVGAVTWGRRARRGFLGILIALVLLALAVVVVSFQSFMTRGVHGQALLILAGQNAMSACEATINETFEQLCRMATDPSAPGFAELRRRLVMAGSGTADLTDLVRPGTGAALLWKRERSPGLEPVGKLTLDAVQCRVDRILPLPDSLESRGQSEAGGAWSRSPDERTGILQIRAGATAKLAGRTVRREIIESRELKLAVAGAPRPFDQVGLYVADLHKVTDPVKANQLRDRILATLDDIKRQLTQTQAQLAPDVSRDLEMIRKGLPDERLRERMVPRLPETPACLVGVSAGSIDLDVLDLAAKLQQDLARIGTAREELARALGQASSDGGRALLAQTVAAVKAFNQALMRIWLYRRELKPLPRDSQEFKDRIGRYEERLTPGWFEDRILTRLDPASTLFGDWLAGNRQLIGTFRLVSTRPVELRGPLTGRAVLVVDAPAVTLADLPASSVIGDLVTVVVNRGAVRLSGKVHALLIATDAAQVEVAEGTQLTGGLIFTGSGLALRTGARLARDPWAGAGSTVEQALARPGRGIYTVSYSPTPLWVGGERQ